MFPIVPPRTVQAPFNAYGSQTLAAPLLFYGIRREQLQISASGPGPLRHVMGFPHLGLLWVLRHHEPSGFQVIPQFPYHPGSYLGSRSSWIVHYERLAPEGGLPSLISVNDSSERGQSGNPTSERIHRPDWV